MKGSVEGVRVSRQKDESVVQAEGLPGSCRSEEG